MTHVLVAIVAITSLAIIFGLFLGFASIRFRVESDPMVDKIDHILPQTQCGQCGYPGCRPYAEAIAQGDDINKCPPGGQATIEALAALMGVEAVDSAYEDDKSIKKVAVIDEENCIGCTKCIQACPVDAIVGSTKLMHTVIQDYCTGCDLCVAPCPTDCIHMKPLAPTPQQWNWQQQQIPTRSIVTDPAPHPSHPNPDDGLRVDQNAHKE